MADILITGGAGFYGSIVARRLLASGHKVHVIDNLMYGPLPLMELFINPNYTFTKGDVLDRELMKRVAAGKDFVVHLAALVGYPLCKKEPERARQVNVGGTSSVISALDGQTKLIYASTGSNYGEVEGICTEETPLNPLSLYGETKTEAEYMCMGRGNCVSYRFATAFGLSPRLRLDLMINDFTFQALVNRYLVVYEKHFRRTFIHIQDMARCVEHTVDNFDVMRNNVYNVGDDSMNFTKEDIVLMLRKKIDFMSHFAAIGEDADKRDYEVSYEKIRKVGFRTEISMEQGMDELIAGLSLLEVRKPYSNV
ncbi:MAG: SDR family oxidoreductase [Proteobacteria bacterium]|nr:SDR family oxidoreductase [Pseudomonadota bacterium]MCP4916829.1 SDR family oxidoreductase [Pseudomonadota bacterium]